MKDVFMFMFDGVVSVLNEGLVSECLHSHILVAS